MARYSQNVPPTISTAESMQVNRMPNLSKISPPQISMRRNTFRKLYAPVKKPNSPLVQWSSLSSMLLRGAMMSFT